MIHLVLDILHITLILIGRTVLRIMKFRDLEIYLYSFIQCRMVLIKVSQDRGYIHSPLSCKQPGQLLEVSWGQEITWKSTDVNGITNRGKKIQTQGKHGSLNRWQCFLGANKMVWRNLMTVVLKIQCQICFCLPVLRIGLENKAERLDFTCCYQFQCWVDTCARIE